MEKFHENGNVPYAQKSSINMIKFYKHGEISRK